jgi:Cu(I)/Ag(I) efflux system membrane fusion protein
MTTKNVPTLCATLLAIGAALIVPISARAAEPVGYESIAAHYESIRQALLHDHMDGVASQALSLRQESERLGEGFEASVAAVPEDRAADCLEILPELRAAADEVAAAADLTEAREAFGVLSKAMVRYRQMLAEPDTVVVYCPMAEQVWLQPEGEIGNPYFGQQMARCGQLVSD